MIKESITCEPELSEWVSLANRNKNQLLEMQSDDMKMSHNKFRQGLLTSACLKSECDIKPDDLENKLLIITGHQPVVYHSGIARKNNLITSAEGNNEILSANIIIDTDFGEALEVAFPEGKSDKDFKIGTVKLTRQSGIYRLQKMLPQKELEKNFSIALSKIIPEYKERLHEISRVYIDLAEIPVPLASAKARRHFESSPLDFETTLSDLLRTSTVQDFFLSVLQDSNHFHNVLNQKLDAYRKERKIGNHANPFPNLLKDQETIELPFWIIDKSTGLRHALFLDTKEAVLYFNQKKLMPLAEIGELLKSNEDSLPFLLAPRAVLITAMLRILGSDLFVHGTGGARYDNFTDEMIKTYWQMPVPAFAVASETRLINPEYLSEIQNLITLKDSSRDMQYHLDSYLGKNIFSTKKEAILCKLWGQRITIRDKLIEEKKNGNSTAGLTQELKSIDSDIKSEITCFLESLEIPEEEKLKALSYREFPFYFFN